MLSSIKRNVLQQKLTEPALVAFYDIRPGKGANLFSREKISTGGDK